MKNINSKDIIYSLIIKGRDIKISDVISYPASGLNPNECYLVTVSKISKKKRVEHDEISS